MDHALTSDEQDALERWASGLLGREIPINNPATIHVDEVFRGLGSDRWLVKTLGSFRVLLEIAGAMPGIQVVACIGLGSTSNLDTNVPTWSSIEIQDGQGSPSLYLMNKESLLLPNLSEEYKCPIVLPIEAGRHFSYYRCFRTPDAIENDWEYEKAVYIESL